MRSAVERCFAMVAAERRVLKLGSRAPIYTLNPQDSPHSKASMYRAVRFPTSLMSVRTFLGTAASGAKLSCGSPYQSARGH